MGVTAAGAVVAVVAVVARGAAQGGDADAAGGSDWTSLEVTKLVVAVATPVAVLVAGWLATRWLQRQVNTDDKLIEKRIVVFDKLAPGYNDLLTYLLFWGAWQEMGPDKVIETKRALDKGAHVYSWLFRGDVLGAHNELMELCFATFQEKGQPARIRSSAEPRRGRPGGWRPEWNDLFTGENSAERAPEIKAAYEKVLRILATELTKRAGTRPFVTGTIVTHG